VESLHFDFARDGRIPVRNINSPRCVAHDETVALHR